MGDQSLRSMASAEHWRQEGTNYKFSRLTATDRELLPLQSQRRSILTAFKSNTSPVP